MKIVILSLVFILSGYCSHSQTEKATIYCNVYTHGAHQEIKLDYYGAEKYLPDSISKTVLIDYTTQYRLRESDENNVLLLLSALGWKLTTIISSTRLDPTYYILSKEISMDANAHQLYIDNIKNSFKKSN